MAKIMEQQLDPALYESIGYDDLVTYAVYKLVLADSNGGEATFEDIVAQAFTLFPKRFSLRGYHQWPDSAVVNKSWLRCRTDKNYIIGSVKDGFKLTQRGLEIAESVERKLGNNTVQSSRIPKIKSELRTRSGRLLRSLEQTSAFQAYGKTRDVEGLTTDDLTDVLLTLPDSPPNRLRSNLEQFRDAAKLYERTDILDFLDALEAKFAIRLGIRRN